MTAGSCKCRTRWPRQCESECARECAIDAAAAGVQPSCRAFAVDRPFAADAVRRELRACAQAAEGEACFTLVPDPAQCGATDPGVRADVDARGDASLEGKHIVVECLSPST